MSWPLPPLIEWSKFLRLLRHPSPPKGWLESAAELPDLRKRPMLLRWIAQHPKAPAHLRANLMARLPWRALAAMAIDAAAHPQARAMSTERLQTLWMGMSLGERKNFAILAPPPLWPLMWKVPNLGVIASFLQNPRLTLPRLKALILAPIQTWVLEALAESKWREFLPIVEQVLQAMDESFQTSEHSLVLSHAVPWIKLLDKERRLFIATRLKHPPLRRMVRNNASR